MEFERPDPAITHHLVPACKCDSHKQAVRGELTAKQTGIYTLFFDNTYSRQAMIRDPKIDQTA
jgi:hypothetical protein